MFPSLIQIGSKTAEKNSAQTNKQTDTAKIMVTWPWTKSRRGLVWSLLRRLAWNSPGSHMGGFRNVIKPLCSAAIVSVRSIRREDVKECWLEPPRLTGNRFIIIILSASGWHTFSQRQQPSARSNQTKYRRTPWLECTYGTYYGWPYVHCISKKFPPFHCLWVRQILTDFPNFCTAGKRMKLATKSIW